MGASWTIMPKVAVSPGAARRKPGQERSNRRLDRSGFGKKSWLGAAIVVAAAGFGLSANDASAEFRVCNATQTAVGVAIGYRAKEGWISEGWWQIPPTTCSTLIEGQLQSRYYYLYAEDAARGGRWSGNVNMCVADNEFKITGVQDCYARGYQQFGFKEYDTGRQGSWMVQLTDTPATNEGQN
jgi:uncharacterized membrane protein